MSSAGRCAGCGLSNRSSASVRGHVRYCPQFAQLPAERQLDPEAEFRRYRDAERQQAREARKEAAVAEADRRRAEQADRWRTPADILEEDLWAYHLSIRKRPRSFTAMSGQLALVMLRQVRGHCVRQGRSLLTPRDVLTPETRHTGCFWMTSLVRLWCTGKAATYAKTRSSRLWDCRCAASARSACGRAVGMAISQRMTDLAMTVAIWTAQVIILRMGRRSSEYD